MRVWKGVAETYMKVLSLDIRMQRLKKATRKRKLRSAGGTLLCAVLKPDISNISDSNLSQLSTYRYLVSCSMSEL
jgi:hypothetical protein